MLWPDGRFRAGGRGGLARATEQFLPAAESSYALARELETEYPDEALSHFFATVKCSWPSVESYLQTGRSTEASERAWQLYHSAVARMIQVGQDVQLFNSEYGLTIPSPYGPQQIETIVYGGVWTPEDVAELHLVGNYRVPELRGAVRHEGVGIPLVAAGPEQRVRRWVRSHQLFAATALLHRGDGLAHRRALGPGTTRPASRSQVLSDRRAGRLGG